MASRVASIATLASANLASEVYRQLWQVLRTCRRNKSSDITPYFQVFENLGLGKDSCIAAETLQQVFSDLHCLCIDFAFLFGILHSPSLDHKIKHPIAKTPTIFGCNLTGQELVAALSFLQPGLVEISVHGLEIGDEFLRALSASPVASTLKVLALRGSLLTDSTASAWEKFPQLRHVDLYASFMIGLETFEAIISMPLLEHFAIDQCSQLSDMNLMDTIAIINPPNLKELSLCLSHAIRAGEKWKSHFLEPLKRWEGRVNVDISLGGPLNDERVTEFIELCPNITRMLGSISDETLQKYASNLSAMKQIEIFHDFTGDAESILGLSLGEYGRKMPLLEDLLISGCPSDWDWLSAFSNLTVLYIFGKGTETPFQDPIVWPPRLKCLVLNFSRAYRDRDVVHETIKQICLNSSLESVSVGPTDSLTAADIHLILKSLPNLTYLEFDNGWGDDEPVIPTIIEVSHAKLRHLQAYGLDPYFTFTYKNTPNLVEIDGGESYIGQPFSKENNQSFPKLQKLTGPRTMLDDKTWAALPTICPHINMLQVEAFFPSFAQLESLVHLTLKSAAVSVADLTLALDQMPQLSNLHLIKCEGVKSLDWLQHQNLRNINVTFAPTQGSPLMIHLGENSLPSIMSILIAGEDLEQITIDGLQHLLHLEIVCMDGSESPAKDRMSITISHCNSLNQISIADAPEASALKLLDLRSLELLQLTESNFDVSESVLTLDNCPNLSRYSLESSKPATRLAETIKTNFPNATKLD